MGKALTSSTVHTDTGVSIVIPNYNGAKLLQENLPSVFTAVSTWGGTAEVIIVDDCSMDGSCQLIREEFPQAKLLVNSQNLGFSKTCNAGMAIARFPVLVCINTDVRVEENLLQLLLPHFTDPELFAVTPRVNVEREGKNQGTVFAAFRRGFIRGGFSKMDEDIPVRENLYAIGACVAYDARKFQALEGYCEIFSPFLFEDVDISYRAWKRGWKSMYEPGATVWHFSNATINKDKAKLRHNHMIYFRNRFIFHWINLSDPAKVISNILNTLLRLLINIFLFKLHYYVAFFGALKRWKAIAELRRKEKVFRTLRDADVFKRTARNAN